MTEEDRKMWIGRIIKALAVVFVGAAIYAIWWLGAARDRYHEVQSSQAEIMAQLLDCAQAMEECQSNTASYLGCLSSAHAICNSGSRYYTSSIQVSESDDYFLVRGTPISGSPVVDTGSIELDSSDARRWDRNDDGDFDDAEEDSW